MTTGYLQSINGQLLGQAIIAMGGGRTVADAPIDFSVGIQMHCKVGASIIAGQPILNILCNDDSKLKSASMLVDQSIKISDDPQTGPPLWRDFLIK